MAKIMSIFGQMENGTHKLNNFFYLIYVEMLFKDEKSNKWAQIAQFNS